MAHKNLIFGFALFFFFAVTTATLPFESQWQQVSQASFVATSIDYFSGDLQVPTASPVNPRDFFAIVMKLESITVTEGLAAIVAWNTSISSYTLQLYYTTTGADNNWSPILSVAAGSNISFSEDYDYSTGNWEVLAYVNSTGQSLSLTFGQDLTLGQATIELLVENPTGCDQLPASNLVHVVNIGSTCSFLGCGPWITSSWGSGCGVNPSAHGAEALFKFASSNSTTLITLN